jgi:hypothetical protein
MNNSASGPSAVHILRSAVGIGRRSTRNAESAKAKFTPQLVNHLFRREAGRLEGRFALP